MEGVLAVVTNFAGTFAPKTWAFCNGQQLAINSNQALFSLLGTTFGGNGTTTFGLPNLQGRVPIGTGTGGSLPAIILGQVAGTETVTLTSANLPPHVHNGPVAIKQQCSTTGGGDSSVPTASFLALNSAPSMYGTTATAGQTMKGVTTTAAIGIAGSSQPVNIMHPYIAIYYIICTQGIFPSRN